MNSRDPVVQDFNLDFGYLTDLKELVLRKYFFPTNIQVSGCRYVGAGTHWNTAGEGRWGQRRRGDTVWRSINLSFRLDRDLRIGGTNEREQEYKCLSTSPDSVIMRASCLLLLSMPVLLVAQRFDELYPVIDDYGTEYEFTDSVNTLSSPQQQVLLQRPFDPVQAEAELQTEPTEPGPLDCREEQYPCTRLYSVHKPCRQCLNSLCFYSLRRVYVVNKEVCVRTVCAHEELLRADMCRDQFSRCGVAALSGQCGALGASCGKSCGGC
ncbi:hypothetical protein SKAU_G00172510 [Synaphobranchus kaupii]|uniref:Microfibrillar-associated protein 2 n=1 Tax=Synaphobranchus kaupii TaxID=118154 RepID=A0A9Q1FKV3_SYNKA|nr:hypothetical protein SKAU_G00172510 [Synaphobranchus kaupii]